MQTDSRTPAATVAESVVPPGCAELYEPFAGERCVVAHLGQSIDGFVATDSGDSYYVTGPQNIDHLHRMRALADAVVVGARTVETDDPRLTTRRVAGPNATRVVLDGRRRLGSAFQVFSDGQAPTLLVCAAEFALPEMHGQADVIALPATDGHISPHLIVAALAARGLRRIFIEGGGAVVSEFLRADALDRLQLTIAPVMIGSGRPGVRAPASATMAECLRPPHRLFRLGDDLLYDYDLRARALPGVLSSTVERLR